jgi:hypothetical protein
MKIHHKQALEALDRFSLQIALAAMTVVTIMLCAMFFFAESKAPLIIERGCDSRIATIESSSQTAVEIDSFLNFAIPVRFHSNPKLDPALVLTQDLLVARLKEQQELKAKSINQRVIVRSIRSEHGRYLVEADRLIAVGAVRTAVPLNLAVDFSSKIRSVSNPYGLILTFVDQIKEDSHGK